MPHGENCPRGIIAHVPRGNQLARQWQLLQMIQYPAGIAVDDAARKLECTLRTIWSDLSALQKAGSPLYDDKGTDGRRFPGSSRRSSSSACRSRSHWPRPSIKWRSPLTGSGDS